MKMMHSKSNLFNKESYEEQNTGAIGNSINMQLYTQALNTAQVEVERVPYR